MGSIYRLRINANTVKYSDFTSEYIMTRQEPTIFEAMQRWYSLIQKLIKILNKNRIPKDYQGMKNMIAELEAEEKQRNDMNKMRERIIKLQKDKQMRARWAKLERRRKIRAFLHLPYKTYNEDKFFEHTEE